MATYKINVRRYYYGPRETVGERLDNETGQPWRGTHREAQEEIDRMRNCIHQLSSGEYCSPWYTIAIAKD